MDPENGSRDPPFFLFPFFRVYFSPLKEKNCWFSVRRLLRRCSVPLLSFLFGPITVLPAAQLTALFLVVLTSDVELYLTALCRSGNKLIITALSLETKYGYCSLSFRLGCLWFKPSSLTCSLTREILVAVLLCHVPSHEEANLIKMETLP